MIVSSSILYKPISTNNNINNIIIIIQLLVFLSILLLSLLKLVFTNVNLGQRPTEIFLVKLNEFSQAHYVILKTNKYINIMILIYHLAKTYKIK